MLRTYGRMKSIINNQLVRQRFRQFWRSLTVGIVVIVVLIVAHLTSHPAEASQRVEFRVSRLESETRSLRSQISQLQSEINRLSRTTGDSRPSPVISSPEPEPTPALDGTDLPFDRLATLVIETRQDMFRLQEQVEAIANQLDITLPTDTSQ
ncbi:MAG: hypothetical protein AAFQ57_02845 [Cyanobacteria bacterium J06626_14]